MRSMDWPRDSDYFLMLLYSSIPNDKMAADIPDCLSSTGAEFNRTIHSLNYGSAGRTVLNDMQMRAPQSQWQPVAIQARRNQSIRRNKFKK